MSNLSFVSFNPTFAAGSIVDASCGYSHTCVLLLAGRILCYGSNSAWQLGDDMFGGANIGDNPVQMTSMVPVSFRPTILAVGAVSVAAGGDVSCALFANGRTICCK